MSESNAEPGNGGLFFGSRIFMLARLKMFIAFADSHFRTSGRNTDGKHYQILSPETFPCSFFSILPSLLVILNSGSRMVPRKIPLYPLCMNTNSSSVSTSSDREAWIRIWFHQPGNALNLFHESGLVSNLLKRWIPFPTATLLNMKT